MRIIEVTQPVKVGDRILEAGDKVGILKEAEQGLGLSLENIIDLVVRLGVERKYAEQQISFLNGNVAEEYTLSDIHDLIQQDFFEFYYKNEVNQLLKKYL